MNRKAGEDVVQILIDTGVLTENDAAKIHSVQTEVIMQHMREHDVLTPAEEDDVREVLVTLTGGGPLAKRLAAKIRLVGVITNNVHRKMERQSVKTREQRERCS